MQRFTGFNIDDYTQLCDKFYSKQTASTLSAFVSGLKRIQKIYDDDLQNLDLKFLKDPEDVIIKLDAHKFSLNTKISTISTLLKCLKIIDAPLSTYDSYNKKLASLMNIRNTDEQQQTMTLNQKENWIEYPVMVDTINTMVDKYLNDNKPFNEFRNFMMLSLYILHTPIRISNYLNCKILRNIENVNLDILPNNYNYIYKDTTTKQYTYIFNKYKTSKILGQKIDIVKNEKLNMLLDVYFKNYNINSKHFIVDITGTEIKGNTFTDILKDTTMQIFNKSFSVNIIRHSFLTHFIKSDPTLLQKIEVASDMHQSYKVNMQDLYVKYY